MSLKQRTRLSLLALAGGATFLAVQLATGNSGPRASGGVRPTIDEIARDDSSFSGVVAERLDAGSYAYFRLDVHGASRWVVTLGDGPNLGEDVTVKPFGVRENFESKRLGRTFDRVFFTLSIR